ncbi:hypothetical protein [Pseudomonas sp. URMO17WK12:I4]|mgnify:FL=1|uniref:DUF6911 family protein n=1 Tax=Pseudomonas sp. URMO17WK12:I4 TaxID=1283292 RepID=UPI0012DC8117|nr:hypothetical protein [Pseudomonas sp. URMO17WK12:I4]
MSKDTVLGGYLIGSDGVRYQLPITLNPSASIVEDFVRSVSGAGKGVVVIRCKASPDYGPYELEMYVESGKYLLMLNECDEDGEHCVRTITNKDVPDNLIVIMGEKYPAKAITRDIGLVCTTFNTFARFGNISMDLFS